MRGRAGVGRQDENESIYKRSNHKRDNGRATLKFVCDGTVETATLAELRGPDTDAAAVTQFVDAVENIDDIETDFDRSLLGDLESALQINVERFIRMVLLGVCKTPP